LSAFWSLNYQSSEGARAYLTNLILDYLAVHPWTGSNFAGLYLIYDELNGRGSAHNQYTDVFFRTGVIGFALYLWMLSRIVVFFRHDRAILVGLVAVLIYGIFHETFKLGHGGFLFGFLLSYQFWMRRQGSSLPSRVLDPPGLATDK
jgi:O-antigen ligase